MYCYNKICVHFLCTCFVISLAHFVNMFVCQLKRNEFIYTYLNVIFPSSSFTFDILRRIIAIRYHAWAELLPWTIFNKYVALLVCSVYVFPLHFPIIFFHYLFLSFTLRSHGVYLIFFHVFFLCCVQIAQKFIALTWWKYLEEFQPWNLFILYPFYFYPFISYTVHLNSKQFLLLLPTSSSSLLFPLLSSSSMLLLIYFQLHFIMH